jgi:hypothetical protein
MTNKFAFRAMGLLLAAALLCLSCGPGGGSVNSGGGEVDAYLGMFRPMLDIRKSPDSGGTVLAFPTYDSAAVYKYGDTVTLTVAPNNGYAFMGWSGVLKDTAQSLRIVMDGHKVLTANFTHKYVVVFHANGGTGAPPAARAAIEGSIITLPDAGDMKKTESVFSGWISARTGGDYLVGASYNVVEDDTLYAKWGTEYTVRFSANGGSGTPPQTRTVAAGSGLTLPDSGGLHRDKRAFCGWSTNTSAGPYHGAGKMYTPAGSVTLYAGWVNVYVVTFSLNGGSGATPDSYRVLSGTVITLPRPGDRSGYMFGGWTDGHGETYQAGASYTVKSDAVISAEWIGVYTVTFNLNEGIGTAPSPQSAVLGATLTLPMPNAAMPGHVFMGWNTDPSGSGIIYQVGSAYTVTGSVTLYAYWESP